MKRNLFLFLSILLCPALLLSACGPGKVSASNLKRDLDPQVPPADTDQLVSDNTSFAFSMYREIRGSGENIVFSPFSISLAFAMTYAGARGETATQMAEVMQYSLGQSQLHPAINSLDQDLNARPDQLPEYVKKEDRFQLNISNSLWGQEDWAFLPEFLDLLAQNYGAGMRLVDFQGSPEAARRQINQWVSDETADRIRDILPAGVIDSSTRLVLANAIYFKSTWQAEFDPDETQDAPFHLLNGETVQTSMMAIGKVESLPYASGQGWQAVTLPYLGGLTEMVVIVPDEGTFTEFESNFAPERYAAILGNMQSQQVLLSMPKYRIDQGLGLKNVLIELGMTDAFDANAADFSGIDGVRDLVISDALHKAFIAVDEKGTEAAAATVVVMMLTSMPMQDGIPLTIDRPFIYLIRDVPTGTVLFMGRVIDPR